MWQDAPIGKELAVAPEPEPGTSCIPMPFRRFSQAEARALLSRRRLLLLGDSVMSYWYLSLAHFLHSGDTLKSWNARDHGHETPLFEPLWVGRAWRTADWWAWNAYYSGSNGDFGEHEICDCSASRVSPSASPQPMSAPDISVWGEMVPPQASSA